MGRRGLAAVVGAVAVVSVFAVLWVSRGGGTPTGRGIVFQSKVHGMYQLFTVDPDGSQLRQITDVALERSSVPGVEQPAWSPDGKTIMFDSDYKPTKQRVVSLFSVRPDGSKFVQVPLEVGLFDGAPAYSPDGKTIAFDWDENGEALHEQGIDLADVDGSDVRRLTALDSPNRLHHRATWSPDGEWVTFTERRGEGQSAILELRLDGSGLSELTPWELNADNARWSPDGSRILFNSHEQASAGESANVYTVKPDGTGLAQLTHYTGGRRNAYGGGWSPDGKQIVFELRSPGSHGPRVNQLFVMDADGRNVRQLTHLPRGAEPRNASWSPAG